MLSGSYQFGGTASLATGNQSDREIGSDSDTTGIGIWSWQIFRGQGKSTLRIATLYIPVLPNQRGGTGSFYEQHLNLFNNMGRIECPRYTFLLEVLEAIYT